MSAPRYIAGKRRTKLWLDGDDFDADPRTITILEAEDKPQPTGLVDENGTELYRVTERRPVGFMR